MISLISQIFLSARTLIYLLNADKQQVSLVDRHLHNYSNFLIKDSFHMYLIKTDLNRYFLPDRYPHNELKFSYRYTDFIIPIK